MNEELDAVFKDVNSSLPQRKIVQLIERTNLSADMKALLSDLARLTIKIGGKILAIGRKILTFIFDVVKLLPGITLGVLAAIVISSIIGAIPIIGAVLAAFLSTRWRLYTSKLRLKRSITLFTYCSFKRPA